MAFRPLDRRAAPHRRRPSVESLSSGPWVWPRAHDERRRLSEAEGLVCAAAPVGSVVLVTADAYGAAVWALRREGGLPTLRFGVEARQSWSVATAALARSVPVLWQSPAAFSMPVGALLLGALHRRPDPVTRVTTPALVGTEIDGPSFGLAFFIALASSCYGIRVRRSVAATAQVDSAGRIGKVDPDTLADKLVAISDLAPTVRTVIVAREQESLARGIIADLALAISIRAVDSAVMALPLALSTTPARLLADAGRWPSVRGAVLERLFRLSLAFRSELVDWDPTEQACARLLTRPSPWGRLTGEERWRLQFVRAVAARRSNNRGQLPRLTTNVQRGLTGHERASVVAHYVRHGADTGMPTLGEARSLARQFTRSTDAWLPSHVRVLGALAAYCAIRGRFSEAIRLQLEGAEVLRRAGQETWAESSYQYSELYRLAGVSNDFRLLRSLDRRLAAQEALGLRFGHDGALHVRLARAKGLVMCGRTREGLAALEAVATCHLAPENPASSLLRWRVRALDDLRQHDAADALLSTASFADARHPVLVALDRHIRRQEWTLAARQLSALGRIDPGPTRHLLAVAPKRIDARLKFVQRAYPY